MNKIISIFIVILFIAAIGGAMYFLMVDKQINPSEIYQPKEQVPNQQSPLINPTNENPPAQEPVVKSNVVKYTDDGYSPSVLTIKVGQGVDFENNSSKNMWPASAMHPTHAVYSGTTLSEHCPDKENVTFDACKGIQPADLWTFLFNKPGTFKYHDHLNPSKTGTIIVE